MTCNGLLFRERQDVCLATCCLIREGGREGGSEGARGRERE